MVTDLIGKGELTGITVDDCFVTFMAGFLRSVRFGASSSHGKANMMCFNYFEDQGAFERNKEGYYKVNSDKFRLAMNEWAARVLIFEGDGDYQGAAAYLEKNGKIRPGLQADLDRLKTAKIPVDIVYDQGVEVLGLQPAGSERRQMNQEQDQTSPEKNDSKSQQKQTKPANVKRPAPTPVR
jgi:hypothetical protein